MRLYDICGSPFGELLLCEDGGLLKSLEFSPFNECSLCPSPLLNEAKAQLKAYFERKLTVFELPLAPEGTPFQLRVWEQLRHIPYGHTVSYGFIASAIGQPSASRAVGGANGKNPLPIIIPCHRVIASGGGIGGFSGGLDKKRFLLELERSL